MAPWRQEHLFLYIFKIIINDIFPIKSSFFRHVTSAVITLLSSLKPSLIIILFKLFCDLDVRLGSQKSYFTYS